LPVKSNLLQVAPVDKSVFAQDIPIEHHDLPNQKMQVWLQRLTSDVICKRIEKVCVAMEEKGIGISGGQNRECGTMSCPHDEASHPNILNYLGVQLVFCFDCAMLMQGKYIETGYTYCSLPGSTGAQRYHRMKSEYDHWVATRKITWVFIENGYRADLEPYKRQMGF